MELGPMFPLVEDPLGKLYRMFEISKYGIVCISDADISHLGIRYIGILTCM